MLHSKQYYVAWVLPVVAASVVLLSQRYRHAKIAVRCNLIAYTSDESWVLTKQRFMIQAANTGWFDNITVYGPRDLPLSYRLQYADILRQPRGAGYWLWKFIIIEMALQNMQAGEFLVYADVGSTINAEGAVRFHEYLQLLASSPVYDVLAFRSHYPRFSCTSVRDHCSKGASLTYRRACLAFANNTPCSPCNSLLPPWIPDVMQAENAELLKTTERVFAYFAVASNMSSIRDTPQLEATVLIMRKGVHAKAFLQTFFAAMRDDPWMITDRYNAASAAQNPYFCDNRHDQSISSVALKLLGSLALPNSELRYSECPQCPFWATRTVPRGAAGANSNWFHYPRRTPRAA